MAEDEVPEEHFEEEVPEDGVPEDTMQPIEETRGGAEDAIHEEIPEEVMMQKEDPNQREDYPETFDEDFTTEGAPLPTTLATTTQAEASAAPVVGTSHTALSHHMNATRSLLPLPRQLDCVNSFVYEGEAGFRYSEEALADDDGVEDPFGVGGSTFRLVYSGPAREFVISELSPACRYRLCVRLQPMPECGHLSSRDGSDEHTPESYADASNMWSEELVLETDATDSAHRIDFEDINVFEVLGEGAFSVVYRGEHLERQVAVKRLKYQHLNEELVTKFSVEVAILSRVRHRNVVAFVGAVTEQPNLCVVMEYMDAGSLHQAIHKQSLVLPLPRLLQIAMDVAQGCNYLHRQKPMIIHRDLKSQNILLTAGGIAKIADFGLSRFQQDMASMTGQVGTPGWTAPEVYKHNSYNHKVDVYSFAVVLAECLSCEKPYAGMDAMQIAFATVYRNKRPTLPSTVPTPLEKLIKACWDQDPKKRPQFTRIIEQLRAIERTTEKATTSSSTSNPQRTSLDKSHERTAAPPARAGSLSASDGTGRALRPKGSASAAVGAVGRERSGSPEGKGRLRRQLERGANAATRNQTSGVPSGGVAGAAALASAGGSTCGSTTPFDHGASAAGTDSSGHATNKSPLRSARRS